MDKKTVQRERMLGYFISAAKAIIEEEGLKSLSARNVGNRAGYSYATIYNYFKDLKELTAYCAMDYLNECYGHLMAIDVENLTNIEKLMTFSEAYFRFFASRPELFHLIFIEDLGRYPETITTSANGPSVGYLLRAHLICCVEEGLLKEHDIDVVQHLITSSIHGKLMFFNYNRQNLSIEEVVQIIRAETAIIINHR